jgi:hypothetical protein
MDRLTRTAALRLGLDYDKMLNADCVSDMKGTRCGCLGCFNAREIFLPFSLLDGGGEIYGCRVEARACPDSDADLPDGLFPFYPPKVAKRAHVEYWFTYKGKEVVIRPLDSVYMRMGPELKPPSSEVYVEGVSAIGKSHAIYNKRNSSRTDLNEMYAVLGALCCLGSDSSLYAAAKRGLDAGSEFVDRSPWLSPLIYRGYKEGVIYVPHTLYAWMAVRTSAIVVVAEDSTIDTTELVLRTLDRGGIDSGMTDKETYITITRALFIFLAHYFRLPIMNVKDLAIITPQEYCDVVDAYEPYCLDLTPYKLIV